MPVPASGGSLIESYMGLGAIHGIAMAVVVIRDEQKIATLRALQKSADHFQHHLEDLRARGVAYVVLHGDEVVG